MAKRRTDSNRRSTGRHNLAAFLLMLLPGFMFLGLLAPAAVTVKRDAKSEFVDSVTFRSFRPARLPLLTSRAIASAALAEVVLPEPLFSGARLLAQEAQRAFELPDVAAEGDEEIELEKQDDVEDYVTDTLFDESLEQPVLAVDLTPLWDPAIFDVIPPSILRDGYSMYDDFHGGGARIGGAPAAPFVIPEPETGALLALGLVALALRARRTR
jgi:hypothetical protein